MYCNWLTWLGWHITGWTRNHHRLSEPWSCDCSSHVSRISWPKWLIAMACYACSKHLAMDFNRISTCGVQQMYQQMHSKATYWEPGSSRLTTTTTWHQHKEHDVFRHCSNCLLLVCPQELHTHALSMPSETNQHARMNVPVTNWLASRKQRTSNLLARNYTLN